MVKGNIPKLLIVGILLIGFEAESQEVNGATIFASNCSACHTIGSGKILGPDLKGVSERHNLVWIKAFIRNSQKMIADGDEEAIKVFNENSMIPMASFDFTDEQMDALLIYIIGDEEEASAPNVVAEEVSTISTPNDERNLDKNSVTLSTEDQITAQPQTAKNASSNIPEGDNVRSGRELPKEQQKAMARSMRIGLLISLAAITTMAIGAYFALKERS